MREQPGLGADDVLVAVTTLSFDIAGLELYLPLITGARVVIAPGETASDPRALRRAARAQRRDRDAGDADDLADAARLRLAGRAGRSRRCAAARRCRSRSPTALVELGLELWNMYGPTETTIWSTVRADRDAAASR